MRVQKRSPWLASLAIGLAGLALFVGRANADIAIDRGGSATIFPKVVADGERDTLITLSNTSNMPLMAHCAYVQGAGICERSEEVILCQSNQDCPIVTGQNNLCVQNWDKIDFDIFLTTKQPTMWRVSTGRQFDPTASFDREKSPEYRAKCTSDGEGKQVCPGFFFTSALEAGGGTGLGQVPSPPGTPNFRGELKCVQVAEDGSLIPGNWLKGTATIETLGSNQISRYNSINVRGEAESENAFVMRLNNSEFNACPEAVEVTHFATDATNFVAENLGQPCTDGVSDGQPGDCSVRTELTIIPCSQDLVRSVSPDPQRLVAQFEIFDEFETRLTAASAIECWANLDLSTFAGGTQWSGSTIKKTRIYSAQSTVCRAGENLGSPCADDAACGAGGVCGPQSGILALVEQFYGAGEAPPATAATNAHMVNNDSDSDIARVGRCRGALATLCTTNGECGAGKCRLDSPMVCNSDAECVNPDFPGDICDQCMNDEIFLAEPGF